MLNLSFISLTDAQWHYRSCGAADIETCTPEEFECLWKRASGLAIGGAVTTLTGTSGIIAGVYIAEVADNLEAGMTGLGAGMMGVLIDIIAIPVGYPRKP